MVGGVFEVARSLPGWKGLRWERGPALFSTGQKDGAQRSGSLPRVTDFCGRAGAGEKAGDAEETHYQQVSQRASHLFRGSSIS